MLTVKSIYEHCYPLMNKHGITYSLWVRWFLKTLEWALHAIETYEWWLWKRQHYSEQITDMNLWEHRWYIRHQTQFPILNIDMFRWGRDSVIDEYLDFCDCPDDTPDDCVCDQACISSVCNMCDPLKMKWLLPHSKMCPWSFKIAWSDVPGMWWEGGTILHILPAPVPPRMFVSYYRWFPEVTSYNQVINIPRHFINAIKYAIMMDIYVNKGIWGETLLPYFEQKFDKAMLALKKTDTVMWSNIVRGQNDQWEQYPFYWDNKSTNGR
jgi:hypothetical protein